MYTVSIIDYNGTPASVTPTAVNKELYIYDPITNDEGLVLIDPRLSLEVSKAGSFSCSLPETNYGYGRIIDRLTRLIVRKNNKIIFIGRINSEDRDLYLTQKIIAEGALAYLNDSLTTKKTYVAKNPVAPDTSTNTTLFDLLDDIFTNHNNKFPNEPWKKFHFVKENCHADFIGLNSKDVNSKEITQFSVNFDVSLTVIESLLDTADAMLNIEWDETNNYWEVYIYNKYDTGENSAIPKTSQPIEFGLNLLDLTQSYDSTDIVTAVAPFGGDLIQESKEIGDIVAGGSSVVENNQCLWREGWNDNYEYKIYPAGEYANQGYWAYEFDIAGYNALHPDDPPIKRLYLSWRAYKFTTINDYVADNAWRIYERIWDDNLGDYVYQTLGFHELTANGDFESEVNEVIDLTDPQYSGANYILIGGWGGLITPIIRRDALVVEENDKLNISKCSKIDPPDTDGFLHEEGSFYLKNQNLIDTYGLIEKKLEFDIEDTNTPLTTYIPGSSSLGGITQYNNCALGYLIDNSGEEPNYETHKGLYVIRPFGSGNAYTCLEYQIPFDYRRPRGVFITSRMHDYGDDNGYKIDGMFAVLDTSGQVLNYKSAAKAEKGFGFTTIQREFIDLNDPQNFGAEWIRVGCYTGGDVGIELYPSDDRKSRDRLMDQAKLYLTTYQWDKIVIEAQAVDLSMTSKEWDSLDICKLARVLSKYHGADFNKPITALELNLNNFEDNSIKLGYDNNEYMTYQLNTSLRLRAIETSKTT